MAIIDPLLGSITNIGAGTNSSDLYDDLIRARQSQLAGSIQQWPTPVDIHEVPLHKVLEDLFQLLAKCETDEQAITELRGFAMRFMAQRAVEKLRQEEEQTLTAKKMEEAARNLQKFRVDQRRMSNAYWNPDGTGLIKSK